MQELNGQRMNDELKESIKPYLLDCSRFMDDILLIEIPDDALNTFDYRELRRDIGPLLQASKKVILDLGLVEFVDSSGCGTLMSCLRKVKMNDGILKICNLTPQVTEIFRLIQLHTVFDIYDSVEEAVSSFDCNDQFEIKI